jgi:hypothetical protein
MIIDVCEDVKSADKHPNSPASRINILVLITYSREKKYGGIVQRENFDFTNNQQALLHNANFVARKERRKHKDSRENKSLKIKEMRETCR